MTRRTELEPMSMTAASRIGAVSLARSSLASGLGFELGKATSELMVRDSAYAFPACASSRPTELARPMLTPGPDMLERTGQIFHLLPAARQAGVGHEILVGGKGVRR